MAGYFKGISGRGFVRKVGWGGGRFEDILFKRRARQGGKQGQWPYFLYVAKRGREGSRTGIQESIDFNKNINKSGLFNNKE